MLISQRKQSSSNRLNTTEFLEKMSNESFADSTSGKRFNRTKNNLEEQPRARKLSRASDSCNEDERKNSRDGRRADKMPKFLSKPSELFLRIPQTPRKKDSFYQPATSDSTTEASFFPQFAQRQSSLLGGDVSPGRHILTEFRSQIELKNGEVMMLEDEVFRLRKTINTKDEEHAAQIKKQTIGFENEIKALKEQIRGLKTTLQERNSTVSQLKKTEAALNRQIKALKYDKMLLQKQLDEIYKRKLPKDLKQLMSYRQQSLMMQIEGLKQRLEESKTQHEIELQEQVLRLKQQYRSAVESIRVLNAHSHVLSKKLSEGQAHLKEKMQTFGRCYSKLKESHASAIDEMKMLKRQNLKLKRLSASQSKQKLVACPSEESLVLSVDSNN